MKKLVILFSLLLMVSGCSGLGGIVSAVNPLNITSTGFYPLLIIGELETNLSSLVIDKTQAKIENFSTNPFEVLPEKSLIYVMPAIITKSYEKSYDTYYAGLIKQYLAMNNFAKVTDDIEKADFVLVVNISESPERRSGTNFSAISMSIMEKDERPVFVSSITVKSSSDRNFYHRPSKSARPVKELTLVAFEEIFKESLPQAFGLER